MFSIELATATEHAAIAAASLRGRGDEMAADRAAVEAMQDALQRLPMRARIVVGEGDRDFAPKLYVGEEIGRGPCGLNDARADLALAALEGATLCAKDMPGAISIVALARSGALLAAPNVYMDKIAIGPGYEEGVVDLDREPKENIASLAAAKGVAPSEITICILDRPRHFELIGKCRAAGAAVRLISDGDVAGVIFTTHPEATGVDMYLGRGGAPEGVLAAGVLRCAKGQMQGRLVLDSREKAQQAMAAGLADPKRKFTLADFVADEVTVCVTGVTSGPLLDGVVFSGRTATSETLIYESRSRTMRRMRTERPRAQS